MPNLKEYIAREICLYCKKTFKNTTTLSRHCAKYHLEEPVEKENLREKQIRVIVDAISSIINNIEDDLCLDENTRRRSSEYDINDLGVSLTNE